EQAEQTGAVIKTIIPLSAPCYAAFMPDSENDIEAKIAPLVCWSLLSFREGGPDEVIGQIVSGDTIVEVNYVDEEEGFGRFLGYFFSESDAKAAIREQLAYDGEGDEEEEDEEEEDEEEEDEEEEDEDYE